MKVRETDIDGQGRWTFFMFKGGQGGSLSYDRKFRVKFTVEKVFRVKLMSPVVVSRSILWWVVKEDI